MKRNDFSQIGDLYGNMLNGLKIKLVAEGKTGPGAKELNDKGAASLIKKSGPEAADGFKPALQKKKAKKGENKYNLDKLSYEEDEETLKMAKKGLNKFMSKKSAFDKLFENVMGAGDDTGDELQELGIDDGDGFGDEGLGDEGGEEDSVTVTLDRAAAQTLLDVLTAALGGEATEPDGDEGLGDDDGFGDEGLGDEGGFDEDEESKATNLSKAVDTGKQNKVGNLKPSGGSASSAVTDKVGNDGEHGHALHGAKQPNMGKQNKVGNLKSGQGFFQR